MRTMMADGVTPVPTPEDNARKYEAVTRDWYSGAVFEYRGRQPKQEQEHEPMRSFGTSESKYLKGDDLKLANGAHAEPVVTIDRIEMATLARDDGPDDERWILFFRSTKQSKGLVLNVTNEETLIGLFGMPQNGGNAVALSQHFAGKQVVLYFDPTVKFAGKRVGGLRVRGVVQGGEVPIAPTPRDEEPPPIEGENPANSEPEDDIVF